jgi:beta-galactosidase
VKDESSRIVDAPLPGFLRDVMGVTLKDYVPVYNEKIGVQFSKLLAGPEGSCTLWADLLEPSSTSAEVLATYTGAYTGDAAITMNSFGKGKAVYIGADLDPMSLGRVLVTLLAANGVKSEFGVPRGVELTQRKTGNQEWTFLLNHTAAVQEVKLPGKFKDAVSGAVHEDVLHLEPYDARVLTRT